MPNQSRVTEFLLHGYADSQELQSFHFIAFLSVYLAALMENLTIITVIVSSHHLHKPMYFFLANLAFQGLGSISVIVPKSMANSFMNINSISYSGCICQIFLFLFFTASHFFLLGIMAYDRYIAICKPLQYETVMNKKACIEMAIGTWIGGFLLSTIYTGSTFTILFCSNDIGQFFCEILQLFRIACSDSYLTALWVIIVGMPMTSAYLPLILFSYAQIFRAVLRIPSTQGKQKAFSTCMPHLIVILLYFISASFAYLRPPSRSPSITDLLVTILYCMLPPVINPLIYSTRNKELKLAFWKLTVRISSSFAHSYNWTDFRK